MHDVNLRLPYIIGEMKLTQDASKMIETSLDSIPANRHLGPKPLQQRASATEAGDLDVKF
jgi:hypothetical protein